MVPRKVSPFVLATRGFFSWHQRSHWIQDTSSFERATSVSREGGGALFKSILVLGLVLLVAVAGCGGASDEAQEAAQDFEEASKKMAEARDKMEKGKGSPQEMAEAMKAMGEAVSGGETVETVDFRKLKELLPTKAAGMERVDASGEKTSAFGINVSEAEGHYETGDGRTFMTIRILDLGSASALTSMMGAAWAMSDFDRETDHGYERTTTYSGHRAYEEYETAAKRGSYQVLISKRFMVEVNGNGMEMNAIKKAMGEIDIGKLEAMKDHGVGK